MPELLLKQTSTTEVMLYVSLVWLTRPLNFVDDFPLAASVSCTMFTFLDNAEMKDKLCVAGIRVDSPEEITG